MDGHIDSMVIFPGGLAAMNLTSEETASQDLQQFSADRTVVIDVAQGLATEPVIYMLDKHFFRLDLYGSKMGFHSSG